MSNAMRFFWPKSAGQIYKLLFILMPLVYFLLYGWYGFDETDQGFILSLAYRVTLGETPHVDFMYVRPPLTPLLHSLEMLLLPENIEVIGMRFFGFFYLWLSVLFAVLALRNAFDFRRLHLSPWLLAILGFIVSMHNYPPMAWHTIDGVLFTALGAYLLSKGDRWYWIAAGLLALALAPMAKQPFGVVPIVGLAAVFAMHPLRQALRGAGMAALIGGLLLAFLLLVTPGTAYFAEMLRQSFGATDPNEIVWPGIKLYVWPALYAFLPLSILWLATKWSRKAEQIGRAFVWIFLLGFAVFYGIHVYYVYHLERFVQPKFGTYHAMVFCGAALSGIFLLTGERKMALVLTMLAGSWAAGISWGYPTPVHFMVPALFVLVYFIAREIGQRPPAWYYPAITGAAFIAYFAMYQYPFREPHRSEITYHLGDIFPKFNHVYTHEELYKKYGELKDLHERFGDNFTVLPAMPLANYLTNTRPPISIDWAHDAEIAYDYGLERNLQELSAARPFVFVDKVNGPKEAYDDIKQYRSLLTRHVLEHWNKIAETDHYEVFEYAEEQGL